MRMVNKVIIFLLLIMIYSANATTYYVATTGNDSNNGQSESAAWKTIAHAAASVTDGDIVYVKAGTYSGEEVNITGGSSGSPITYEGYKNTPGDVTNIDWWDFETNRNLDAAKMPLMDGGDRSSGTALSMSSYTILKNFQVTNYVEGVIYYNDSFCEAENIIITTIGDISDSYSGTGLGVYYGEGNNTFKNCVVVNAAAEGIMIYASDNSLDNCKTYCDDATNTEANTDYYFEVEGNNNTITNCYIERVGNLDHVGHGFCIKGDGFDYSGNLFENCEARNLEGGGFVVRHRSVQNNTFKNCTAYDATGFLIRDGASNNKFYNCKTIDCYSAVTFFDTDEDGGYTYAGRYNDFYNCIFENSVNVIDFNSYSGNSTANDNRFINCVIAGGTNLFNCDRTNTDNKIINSIITNVTNLKDGSYSLGAIYTNTDFWNNGFSTPSGTDLLEQNPLFTDDSNGDYSLTSASPCIDAGISDTTGLDLPPYDMAGNDRVVDGNNNDVAIVDMGAYEASGDGSNAKPIADAGPNQTVVDSDESGSESVTLDGSGSRDGDGTITSYVWKKGSSQIATGVNPTVTLDVGTHTITLTVTDDEDATASDEVVITVKENGSSANYALRFNTETTTDEYVAISGIPILSSLTIEFWAKLEVSNDDSDAIINMGGEGKRLTYRTGSHKPTWGEGWNAMSGNGISLNGWHHIAYAANNGTLSALYIDGESQTIDGESDVIMPDSIWYLAAWYFGGESDLNFVGCLDELRLWNYERSAAEIDDNKDTELIGNEEGLVGYWNFNEGSGTLLTDLTGNANGTIHNMESSDWVEGAISIPTNENSQDFNKQIPREYTLLQNYPNPFNPSTMIRFNLAKSQFVNLSVYSMLGEKITELINGNISEGEHSVSFDASNLSSGVYLYKLQTENSVFVRKMILLR